MCMPRPCPWGGSCLLCLDRQQQPLQHRQQQFPALARLPPLRSTPPFASDRLLSQVIFSLGLVDAQVFLVSMHDAIKPNREEFNKFRKNVRTGFEPFTEWFIARRRGRASAVIGVSFSPLLSVWYSETGHRLKYTGRA